MKQKRVVSKKATIHPKRRESDDKNAVAVVKIVPQLGCVSQDSVALVSQRGKQPRGNPMQKVLNAINSKEFDSLSPRHVARVYGKRKDHRLENTSQTSTSAKSQRNEL